MSWGNRILLVIIVFVVLMGYLVYNSVNTRYELVSNEYYKDELNFQQVIDGSKKAQELSSPASLTNSTDLVTLQLPAEMKGLNVKGDLHFYCPTDQTKDVRFPLSIDTSAKQVIGLDKILPGNYQVKISWEANGIFYYAEQNWTRP